MNNQQREQAALFSAREILPGQLGYRQLYPRHLPDVRPRLVRRIGWMAAAGIVLVVVLLFASWHTASPPVHTIKTTANPQNAKVASQVNSLLVKKVAQQHSLLKKPIVELYEGKTSQISFI